MSTILSPPPRPPIRDVWRAASERLAGSAPWNRLVAGLGRRGGVDVVRLPVPAAAWVLELAAAEVGRPLLVVVPHERDAYAWLEAARLFTDGDGAVYFPAPSLSVYQEAEISLGVRAAEAVAVERISSGRAATIVTTPQALCRRLPRGEDFLPSALEIAVGEDRPQEELVAHLVDWGYSRSDLVFEVGQFAVRGGVFDVFPPGEEMPLRLDLFGDTVERIQRFEPESQRSQESVGAMTVPPLSLYRRGAAEARRLAEMLTAELGREASAESVRQLEALREEGRFEGWEHYLSLLATDTVTLPELLERPLVVAVDGDTLRAELEHHREVLANEYRIRLAQERLALPPEVLEVDPEEILAWIAAAEVRLGDLFAPTTDGATADFGAGFTDVLHDQLPRFPREVETARGRGERVVLVTPESHRPRIADLLRTQEVTVGPDGAELLAGELERGFRLPAAGLVVFGERQLLRRAPLVGRAPTRRKTAAFLPSLRDLKIGDYVVHSEHGIGQFVALRSLGQGPEPTAGAPPSVAAAMTAGELETEVMEIAYAGGQRLLLPLARLDQVQKFGGIEGTAPRLDKLGGTSWTRTKKRIKKGLRDMAEELLKLYAERQVAEAPRIDGTESDLVRQFEAAFEYDETPDQLDAIEAIRKDLAETRPMDRLLCGDVGFGKTEVAMRAAMTAVEAGFQVAVLAPTTILADQHLETFRHRFRGLPVEIEMMSRFRTPAEVREVKAKTEAGGVDVLIGTHRLLAQKIRFPNLGLLIVDEEQRFGVAHKEALKQMRKDVHVLAMSATPVPRTLQLSLAGVRELSLIETPPRDRMAVETAILPFEPQLVREAVEFEVARGGQVYYVYNRVETIERMATFLRETIPGLTLTVGHGQLDEHELARRMHAFTAGEYQLLLATTIIENGIDIPNVNTMIVHRADRFGLSQLYQLRGRVGRSDQLAYCYLLVSGDRIVTQEARKRLDAIREFTELGAGFRVAGRDLEIRGAGNLLGAEQSGHIAAVGIETYLKLLEEAVAELKGEKVEEAPSVVLDLPIDMSIPPSWVGDDSLRMELYRRLGSGEEDEAELQSELTDRFGKLPPSVSTLIRAGKVKRLAEELHLQSITAKGGRLVLRLRQDAKVEPERLLALIERHPDSRFSPSGALTLEGVAAGDALERAGATLAFLAEGST